MIEIFFDSYSAAFLNFDAEYISEVYDFPMIFYTEDGQSVSFEEQDFSENTHKLIELYDRLGVKHVEFDIISSTELSKKFELVSVLWRFNDNTNKEIYHSTTRYLLSKRGAGLKIKSVFVIDETSKIKQLMSS